MITESDANVISPGAAGSADAASLGVDSSPANGVRPGATQTVRTVLAFALLSVGVAATAAVPAYGVYVVVRYLLKG